MKLFEAKTYDYKDMGKNKPVLYDETFFKELLKDCTSVEIQSVHDGKVIGYAENLYFEDGWLCGDVPVDIEGKGLSPRFDVYLLDKGDYDLARDGKFRHIALTDNPRNQILYNEKGNDKMTDNNTELANVLANRVKELERELAVTNNKLESNKKKMESYEELEKEVKQLRKTNSEYETQMETNKDKANKWDEYVNTERTELIDDIAGDDSTMKETIKDWDYDKLKFLQEHKNISTERKGIGNGENDINEPPKPSEEEEKEQKAQEFLDFYEKEFGKKPSFI